MNVSEILDERSHRHDAPPGLAAVLSIMAHGIFLVFLAVISRPRLASPLLLTSLPVRVVSPGSLARTVAANQVSQAQAIPAAKVRPVIEKAKPEVIAPSPEALPLPKKGKAEPKSSTKIKPEPKADVPPVKSAVTPEPNGSAVELPSASAGGSDTTGTSNFGASVSSFDADFPFAYYAEQLQTLIGANWLKPAVQEGTGCVVTFRIQRSGQVTDVRIEQTSGLPYYDRAAARSVYAANPLPPLPPEFRREELGVHIRFQ